MHGIQRKAATAALAMVFAIGVSPAAARTMDSGQKAQTGKTAHAAPAAVDTAPRPTPIGSPSDWFPPDAYPPEAKAAGLEGRTAFSLGIDDKGRITGCNITSSSGSPLLDSTTCNLLVTNARFKPARDTAGREVAGTWSSAMVWKLSAPAPLPPEVVGTRTGPSAADIYNQTVSAEDKANDDQSDDQSQSQSQSPPDDGGQAVDMGQMGY